MVHHMVLWRLKDEGRARFAEIRAALEAQVGRIPGLLRVEVGRSFASGRRAVMTGQHAASPAGAHVVSSG